jgi:ubiquinone/menaquinone biosynthesis C-methylase UbiE
MGSKEHPWELAWRSGRWPGVSRPLPAVEDFASYLRRNGMKRVLDLGAGSGRHTIFLAGLGFQLVALDVSGTALEILKARTDKKKLRNVILVRHEMQHLPFPDGYFNGLVCTNVMHHGLSKEVRRSFEEARRVVRKGGAALFVVVSEKDFRFGAGRKLEAKTYEFTKGEEKGIVHHFFGAREFRAALGGFRIVKLWEELLSEEMGNRAHLYAVVRKK